MQTDTPIIRSRGRDLVAEAHGDVVASISLTTGKIRDDQCHPHPGAAALLRRRRYQLLRQGGDSGPAWARLRRS